MNTYTLIHLLLTVVIPLSALVVVFYYYYEPALNDTPTHLSEVETIVADVLCCVAFVSVVGLLTMFISAAYGDNSAISLMYVISQLNF